MRSLLNWHLNAGPDWSAQKAKKKNKKEREGQKGGGDNHKKRQQRTPYRKLCNPDYIQYTTVSQGGNR